MNITDTMAGRDLEALRAALAGQVFVPGEAGYDQARQAWNLAVDEHPDVVVEAESATDVAHAVRYARAHGMRIAPQGTGHGAEPLEPLDGAMLLRTTRMRQVRIDPATRTARAEAGAVWADVTVPAGQHGLAALAGTSPNVGVTGYTLGGGMGWLARRYPGCEPCRIGAGRKARGLASFCCARESKVSWSQAVIPPVSGLAVARSALTPMRRSPGHSAVRWCSRASSRSSQSLASAARNCCASWTGAGRRR